MKSDEEIVAGLVATGIILTLLLTGAFMLTKTIASKKNSEE